MRISRANKPAKAGLGTSSPSSSDDTQDSGSGFVAIDRSRGFWAIIGYAVVFGLLLAFAALAFLGLLNGGAKWLTLPKNPDWFSGSWWWVAVTAGAGVLVGALRRVLRLPLDMPGTLKEILDAVSAGGAEPEAFAALPLPETYRAVTVHADETALFDGLETRAKDPRASLHLDDVPLPEHWGGYVVRPIEVEFWQGRASRLHDRLVYVAAGGTPPLDTPAGWRVERRQP